MYMKMKEFAQYKTRIQIDEKVAYYCYLFAVGSVAGWCLEILFRTIVHGRVIIPGFLNGPYCPIYGAGMLMALVLYDRENKLKSYLKLTTVTTLLEFGVSVVAEYAFGRSLWDYSGLPLSIGSRVNLVFSLIWGVLGLAVILLVEPRLRKIYEENEHSALGTTSILLFLMGLDAIISVIMCFS